MLLCTLNSASFLFLILLDVWGDSILVFCTEVFVEFLYFPQPTTPLTYHCPCSSLTMALDGRPQCLGHACETAIGLLPPVPSASFSEDSSALSKTTVMVLALSTRERVNGVV